VVVRLPPGSDWVVESYPVRAVEELAGGGLEVTFGLLSEIFLERLLLRVGSEAEVVAPAELAGVGRRAALRVLDRYQGSRSVS
jgi:predicted DNA-binding transcriptional regulator YafY